MHKSERIVVTGLGCLTAAGKDLASTWDAINKGETGVNRITLWDVNGWDYPLAAEIKNYDPRTMLSDRKLLKMLSRHDVIGLNAVAQAMDDSAMIHYRDNLSDATEFNDRTGVYVGSPGIRFQQQYDFHPLLSHAQGDLTKFGSGIFDHIHPMWLLKILPNNVLAYTGIQYGFKGANENIANHAVSGIQAIIEAFYALRDGIVDRAVVVGYESGVEPQGQVYYSSLGALSSTGIRSFDVNHDGTILAEAAGCLVLETESSAKARGATIYAEILSGATTNEAMGVFSIRDDADGLIRSMQQALAKANLDAKQIGMITAHANGTPQSDNSEALAIHQIFGASTPVTGFKWSIGHSLTAAGLMDTIFTIKCLQEKKLPGIATLNELAPGCANISASNDQQAIQSDTALVIARGFASLNSTLVIKAP